MLLARSEIYGIYSEPILPFEFCRRHPEAPALLHALRHFGMQSFRLCFVQLCSFETDADRRHWRIARRLELGITRSQLIKISRLTHVVVDPISDLVRTVPFEAHPDFQAPEAPR